MSLIKRITDIINNYEGGYANVPQDKGGETYRGISRVFWPGWEGWQRIDQHKNDPAFPKSLQTDFTLQDEVIAFYEQNYIAKYRLGEFAPEVAEEMFDQLINRNPASVIKDTQTVLNALNYSSKGPVFSDLKVDGIFGSKTIDALNKIDSALLVKGLNAMQAYHYITTAAAKPDQRIFTRGWLKRT
jgi:lysozyme family protein